jgi:hypothetical protein
MSFHSIFRLWGLHGCGRLDGIAGRGKVGRLAAASAARLHAFRDGEGSAFVTKTALPAVTPPLPQGPATRARCTSRGTSRRSVAARRSLCTPGRTHGCPPAAPSSQLTSFIHPQPPPHRRPQVRFLTGEVSRLQERVAALERELAVSHELKARTRTAGHQAGCGSIMRVPGCVTGVRESDRLCDGRAGMCAGALAGLTRAFSPLRGAQEQYRRLSTAGGGSPGGSPSVSPRLLPGGRPGSRPSSRPSSAPRRPSSASSVRASSPGMLFGGGTPAKVVSPRAAGAKPWESPSKTRGAGPAAAKDAGAGSAAAGASGAAAEVAAPEAVGAAATGGAGPSGSTPATAAQASRPSSAKMLTLPAWGSRAAGSAAAAAPGAAAAAKTGPKPQAASAAGPAQGARAAGSSKAGSRPGSAMRGASAPSTAAAAAAEPEVAAEAASAAPAVADAAVGTEAAPAAVQSGVAGGAAASGSQA